MRKIIERERERERDARKKGKETQGIRERKEKQGKRRRKKERKKGRKERKKKGRGWKAGQGWAAVDGGGRRPEVTGGGRLKPQGRSGDGASLVEMVKMKFWKRGFGAVSYTHLTLPTIYSV